MNFIKVFGFALKKSNLAKNTGQKIQHSTDPILLSKLTNGKKIFPYTQIENINPSKLSYIPQFQLGEVINSGLEAIVYNIKNYKNLVARVPRNKIFNPFNLRPANENTRGIVASCRDGSITIMKKLEGEPLHG